MMRDASPADPVTPVNTKVIALLERKLADAKAGKLTAVAVVGGYANGQLFVDSEGNAAPLLLGAVQLQHQLRSAMFPELPQMPGHQFATRPSS